MNKTKLGVPEMLSEAVKQGKLLDNAIALFPHPKIKLENTNNVSQNTRQKT